MPSTHGALIAKLVYTFCLCGVTRGNASERRSELAFPQGSLPIWLPLDVDLMVKALLGTVLGGRAKDSIFRFYANPIPILTHLSSCEPALTSDRD
jgi:hypothetical protein